MFEPNLLALSISIKSCLRFLLRNLLDAIGDTDCVKKEILKMTS